MQYLQSAIINQHCHANVVMSHRFDIKLNAVWFAKPLDTGKHMASKVMFLALLTRSEENMSVLYVLLSMYRHRGSCRAFSTFVGQTTVCRSI